MGLIYSSILAKRNVIIKPTDSIFPFKKTHKMSLFQPESQKYVHAKIYLPNVLRIDMISKKII